MKSLLALTAIALAAPAMAQTAGAPASTNAAQPATPATTATPAQAPQPATDAPATQGTTPAASTESAAPANSADAVAQVVTNDWATYDADKNDGLSKAEFGKWMTALQDQNPAQKAQAKPAGWTDAAYAQADKDKNGAVTKTELQTFLKG